MSQALDNRTATGHVLSTATWLDDHYIAAAGAYEEMFHFAGFSPGAALLDAGSGNGSYLSLLKQESASVIALDFDPDNAGLAASRGADAVAASVAAIPFASGSFDGVWCANVLQFFDDEDLVRVLAEMKRVLKPGGILAVKDLDMTCFRIHPAPPLLGAHLADACIQGDDVSVESHGSLRGRILKRHLERAGFAEVRQRSFPIEYWAPLDEASLRLWTNWLPYLADLAIRRGVPEEDLATWHAVRTPELAETFVASNQFYGCEVQVVAAGTALG